MAERFCRRLPGGARVRGLFTDRTDGDLAVGGSPAELRMRRAALAPVPWTWLRQVHGSRVVTVDAPGAGAGQHADASVTGVASATLSVQVADCAPVLLYAPAPHGAVVAAAHAGWRGLVGGVLPSTVTAMRGLGATRVSWVLGPCISPTAYEFSAVDLEAVAAVLGEGVVSHTAEGRPALDVRAAVAASLSMAGTEVGDVGPNPPCTAGSPHHWSHRARGDSARQAGLIWWESAEEPRTEQDGHV